MREAKLRINRVFGKKKLAISIKKQVSSRREENEIITRERNNYNFIFAGWERMAIECAFRKTPFIYVSEMVNYRIKPQVFDLMKKFNIHTIKPAKSPVISKSYEVDNHQTSYNRLYFHNNNSDSSMDSILACLAKRIIYIDRVLCYGIKVPLRSFFTHICKLGVKQIQFNRSFSLFIGMGSIERLKIYFINPLRTILIGISLRSK